MKGALFASKVQCFDSDSNQRESAHSKPFVEWYVWRAAICNICSGRPAAATPDQRPALATACRLVIVPLPDSWGRRRWDTGRFQEEPCGGGGPPPATPLPPPPSAPHSPTQPAPLPASAGWARRLPCLESQPPTGVRVAGQGQWGHEGTKAIGDGFLFTALAGQRCPAPPPHRLRTRFICQTWVVSDAARCLETPLPRTISQITAALPPNNLKSSSLPNTFHKIRRRVRYSIMSTKSRSKKGSHHRNIGF